VAVAVAACFTAPVVARAQAVVPAAGRAFELALGGSWEAPMSLGTADANFLNNSGGDVPQFKTRNGLGQGFGLEVGLGFGLTRRLWADASGGWTRISLTTDITDDFEGAGGVTLSEPGSRFLVGGGVRLQLSDPKKLTWCVHGGVAWMRETAGGNTLTADGLVTSAGASVDYLWRNRVAGGVRRMGLRVDGRVNFRSGGLTLGEDKLRVGPAVAASIIMGFR
jgi:hypothetical protein